MLKRTMGLSLLGLLVISGLAGRMTNHSLTKPERKKVITLMKETRTELLDQAGKLEPRQWMFRPAAGKKNIRDLMAHIAGTERKLWQMLEEAMKTAASQTSRSEVTLSDDELLALAEDRSANGKAYDPFLDLRQHYKSYRSALEDFKSIRNEHIRYLRTSTEDMRDHVVRLSFGTIDCYQLCLLAAAHVSRHTADIKQLMNDPAFPK